MENNKIEKLFKPKRLFLIITILSILITVALVSFVEWRDRTEVTPKPVEYYDLVMGNIEKEHEYVTVTIVYICSFAQREDTNQTYYYIIDENNLIYIARISDETYKKIETAYNEQQENFSYKLEGYIFNIESDVKKIAIEKFGNVFENAPDITKENYEDYLGKTYLNEYVTPNTETNAIMTGIACMSGIVAIIFATLYISSFIKVYKYTKTSDFEDMKYELEKSTAKHFEKERIYLTDNYIISDLNGLLKVKKYEDIVWIYILKAQQYGVTSNIFIKVKTKNKRELNIANSLDENKLMEIIYLIKQKNPNILIGFTPENQKEYKNRCKEKHDLNI